jgi:hypothetical protein
LLSSSDVMGEIRTPTQASAARSAHARPLADTATPLAFVSLIEPHREELINGLIATAKSKSKEATKAAEILLGYLAAKPRPTAELVHVPDLAAADGLEAKCAVVINAVANGEITSTAARDLLGVISDMAKVIEIGDLEDRVRILEGPEAQAHRRDCASAGTQTT